MLRTGSPRGSGQAGKINTSPCWSLINPPKSPYAVLSRLLVSGSCCLHGNFQRQIAAVSAFVKRHQCCPGLFTPDFCKSALCPGKVGDDELTSPWHRCLPLRGAPGSVGPRATVAQPLASLHPLCRLFLSLLMNECLLHEFEENEYDIVMCMGFFCFYFYFYF